jgi:hypothetical protein
MLLLVSRSIFMRMPGLLGYRNLSYALSYAKKYGPLIQSK